MKDRKLSLKKRFMLTLKNIATHQIDCIENLHLAGLVTARIREEAVIIVRRQSKYSVSIERGITNPVQNFHVPYIVNIKAVL